MRPAAQRPVVDQGDGGEIDFLGLEASGGVEADVDVETAGCFGEDEVDCAVGRRILVTFDFIITR